MTPEESRNGVSLWVMGGSVASAVASSACCWLPLLLIGIGGSAVGIAAFFEKYRPIFLAAAALFLGLGFYFSYFRKTSCQPDSACDVPNRKLRRFNRIVLWLGTVVVLAFALFPNYVGNLLGSPQPPAGQALVRGQETVALAIEGMTCQGCAVNGEKALYTVPGVLNARVSYADGRATVKIDPTALPDIAVLAEAVEKAGYRAEIKK